MNNYTASVKYLERESGQPFAAVIMDLTVPGGMGGKETIEKLLEIDSDVKVVVSSGYATDPIMSDTENMASAVLSLSHTESQSWKRL